MSDQITLRQPTMEDGSAVWALIRACKPLDENSMYCNLLQSDHFRDTCVIAEVGGEIGGWISAYLMPGAPDTLFVWQVAVAPAARGIGLGGRMLEAILDRPFCAGVRELQATVTPTNDASWAMFRSFAKRRNATLSAEPYIDRDAHLAGLHPSEDRITITLA
jgi:L-2,4-diaminobutyric acid acetyltransferase